MSRLRVIAYNIQYCDGSGSGSIGYLSPASPKRRREMMERISGALTPRQPDVLGLIEVDGGSWRNSGVDQAEHIASELDMPNLVEHCKYPPPFDVIPFFKYNMQALASKRTMDTSQAHLFTVGFKRNVIEATVAGITFILCHLALGKGARLLQTQHLARIVKSIETPVVLMGDLNAEPDSPELKNLMAQTELRLVPLGETFPSWKPKKRLDHFLVTPDILVNTASVLDIGLSDHLPIILDLQLDG